MFEDLSRNLGLGLANRGLTTIHTHLLKKEEVHTCKWLRQVDLGPYGRIDIVGYFRRHGIIYVQIIELKSVAIESADFDQILRYKTGIQRYFGNRFNLDFYLYLVGTGFNSGHYIHNNMYMGVAEYTYNLSGISFELHTGDWYKTDEHTFNYMKALHNAELSQGYRKGSAKIAKPDLKQSQIEKQ